MAAASKKPKSSSPARAKKPSEAVKSTVAKLPVRRNSASKTASLSECRRVFKIIPFLSGLRDEDVRALAPLVTVRQFVAGSTVFYEDDETDAVYFLSRGAIEIFKSDDAGKKLPLLVLRDAGVIGEMGVLTKTPRSATARTLTSTRLVAIRCEDFYGALDSGNLAVHRLAFGFARVLSSRLDAVNEKLFSLYQCEPHNDSVRKLAVSHGRLLTEF